MSLPAVVGVRLRVSETLKLVNGQKVGIAANAVAALRALDTCVLVKHPLIHVSEACVRVAAIVVV